MGRNSGVADFLSGAVAGSLVSLAFVCVRYSQDRNADQNFNGVGNKRQNDTAEGTHQLNGSKSNRQLSSGCNDTSQRGEVEQGDDFVGTNTRVISKEEWEANEDFIRQNEAFDKEILSKLKNRDEIEMVLRRSSAVTGLAHALTMANDEKACFEIVSELIVPLFRIDACCYGLMKNSETITYKHLTASSDKWLKNLGMERDVNGEIDQPFSETAAAVCSKTLEQMYCPRTGESPYPAHKMPHRVGMNTVLITPIIVQGKKFIGFLMTYMEIEDGFNETDRLLIKNIAALLGASIYNKRLKLANERSNKIAREIIHSMIPDKVIEKIECFWDKSSDEYKKRRNSSFVDSIDGSDRDINSNITHGESSTSSRQQQLRKQRRQSIRKKIDLLNEINKSELDLENGGIAMDTPLMELESSYRALYAETIPNVCIVFAGIVNFSQMTIDMRPIEVMNVLQGLFGRFDALCDRYGMKKLEVIADTFICTSEMFDQNQNHPLAAVNALNLAKHMIRETNRMTLNRSGIRQKLEIRVGVHMGDLTCGVLGERLPKFTVFGSSVNLAARMKETCLSSRIRVTKEFFDALPHSEAWQKKEVISVKNMGEVETYVLNPLAVPS